MRKLPPSEQPTQVVSNPGLVVREITHHPGVMPPQRRRYPFSWIAALVILVFVCSVGSIGAVMGARELYLSSSPAEADTVVEVVERPEPITVGATTGEVAARTPLSPIFTPEVQFWAPLITEWAAAWEIDPNLIATVIQIESCGDPTVSSNAGAQGLFQVMPFHFDPGEDMLNIANNARRGMNYLSGGLDISEGHPGLALAGYNGGHSVIRRGYYAWASETRRYYYWGAGIYEDAITGATSSPRLQEWLEAGGQSLCNRARNSQQSISIPTATPG